MKYLKTFESNIRKDFSDLTIEHVKDILTDPIDRGVITLRKIGPGSKGNLNLKNSSVRMYNSYMDFDGNIPRQNLTSDHIFLNVAINKNNSPSEYTKKYISYTSTHNSQDHVISFSMQILHKYLRRIYNDYNVSIFIKVMLSTDITLEDNQISRCNIFIVPASN